MQTCSVGLKDGTDSVGNPECRQLRTIFDNFNLTEEIWGVALEFLNGVFRFREGLGRVIGMAAAVGEPRELARYLRCLGEVGNEMEVLELESGGGVWGVVKDGLAMSAILVLRK